MTSDPDIFPMHEYVGNLHIHSTYSDGAASVPEIARLAQKIGLEFIIFNDHAHMTDAIHLEDEGFYEGMPVMMGLEIGVRYHHYLTFGLDALIRGRGLGPQAVIDKVSRQGGFGFLAHPFEKGMPFKEKSIAYTWNDVSVTGYTGICIWNFSSRWKERVQSPLHGLLFLCFKAQLLKGPSQKTLRFWDAACQERRVAAIGGSDAHGMVLKWRGFKLRPLPYEYALNSINVHILLKKPLSTAFGEAKARIYGAMQQGCLFIAHDRLAPARGFEFDFHSQDGGRLCMGEEKTFEPGTLVIKSPQRAEIRLIRNGSLLKKWMARKVRFQVTQKGVYRVEVHLRVPLFGLRPWIFSNPIYLR